MSNTKGRFVTAYHSDGVTVVKPDASGNLTLVTGQTYYLPIAVEDAVLIAAHFQWDSSLVAVISIEDSCRPGVALTDSTAGHWIPEDSTNAYVAKVPNSCTLANMTATVPGAVAGGCMYNLADLGSSIARAKVVVTTGGVMSLAVNGRTGS